MKKKKKTSGKRVKDISKREKRTKDVRGGSLFQAIAVADLQAADASQKLQNMADQQQSLLSQKKRIRLQQSWIG